MAILRFNAHGYFFQESARNLFNAFDRASAGLDLEIKRIRSEKESYLDSLAHDGEWIGDVDQDGNVLWDHEMELNNEIESLEEGLNSLRKSFVVSIYHYWERAILISTGRKQEKHDNLVKYAEKIGIHTHPRLGAVRDAVNTLKHNNAKWGLLLVKSWPDILTPRAISGLSVNWYEAITFTDAHLEEVFNIVTASGPNHLSPHHQNPTFTKKVKI